MTMTSRFGRREAIKLSGALAGAAALGSYAYRSVGAQTTLRFAWWGSEERHNRTIEALELFSEKYPDITVTPEIASFDDLFNKLAVQTAGGNAPDVLQMSGQYINEYSARGALLDLNQFIPGVINISDWDPLVAEHGLIDGQLTGLPIGLDAYTVLYDQTVLDEIGMEMLPVEWTWEEFATFARDVTAAKGEGYYGTTDSGGRYEALETFVRQRGKTLFSEDGTAFGFDEADLTEWWTFWDELRSEGVATSAEMQAAAQSEEQQPLIQGLAATYFTTSGQFVNHQALTEHTLGLHTHPHSADGESGSFIRPALFMSAFSGTDYPEESAQLIEFMLNDPDGAAILLAARGVPPAPAIRELVQSQVSPSEQTAFEFINTITDISTQPNILTPPGGREAADLLSRTYEAIAFGQMSIEEGVATAFEEGPGLLGV
jgi:multiple sugar transport system substrate-binding protein